MPYTKSLAAIGRNELALAGRRGTDLALLAEHKLTVPDTVLVTSEACADVIAENKLQPKIDFLLRHVQDGDTQSLMNVYTGMRRALAEARIPAQLEAELKEAYASVAAEGIGLEGHRPVRVIVSANRDEDPESNDTIIQNVQDQAEFLVAVREAWALPFLPSQLAPRRGAHYPEKDLRVALLVQAMDDPAACVHAYSCLPEDRDKTYLQVYFGELDLRDKVIKDYYAISRQTLHIVDSELSHQPNKLERKDGGFTLVQLPSRHKEDKLIRREIEELARLAKKTERTLESPVKLFFTTRDERPVLLWANRLGFPLDAPAEKAAMEVVDIETSDQHVSPQEAAAQAIVDIAAEAKKELPIVSEKVEPRGNARLLSVSLQLATKALERRYASLFGHPPAGFGALVAQLNERGAFSRAIDAGLLAKAHDAVASGASLPDDEYARAVEEIAFLLANA